MTYKKSSQRALLALTAICSLTSGASRSALAVDAPPLQNKRTSETSCLTERGNTGHAQGRAVCWAAVSAKLAVCIAGASS